MPMTPEQFGALHPRRDRALDRAGQGAQHPARRLSPCPSLPVTEGPHGPQHPGRRRPRRAAHHAHPGRASSPPIRRAAGATRSIAKPTAPSSTGWAAPSARRATRPPRPRSRRCSMLQPAPQATVLGRADKVDMASAALVNGITLAHLRLRRHAPQDHHPSGRPGRLGAAGAGRAPRRRAAASWSTRWCSASTSRAASAT